MANSYRIGKNKFTQDKLNTMSGTDANAIYYATHQGNKSANTASRNTGAYVDTGKRGDISSLQKEQKKDDLNDIIKNVDKIRKSMSEVPSLKKPKQEEPKQQFSNTDKYAVKSALRDNKYTANKMAVKDEIARQNRKQPQTLDYYNRKELEEERSNLWNKGVDMTDLESKRLKEINKLFDEDKLARSLSEANQKQDNYVVHKDRYDSLMQNGRLKNDIDTLVDVIYNNANQDATVSPEWAAEYGAKAITGGLSMDNYIDQLSKRYELTPAELKDMALTRKAELQAESDAKDREAYNQFAKKHPGLGTAGSFLGTAGSGAEGVYNVLTGGITGDDRYTSRMFENLKGGLREGAKENINSNVGKTVYDLATGLGDMGVGVAMGSAPAVLAGNTANSTMLNSLDKGIDARQSALYAGLSGITDFVTNKIGLDKAKELAVGSLKSTGIRRALAQNAIAGAGEAGENVIQDLVQSFLDNVINGKNSDLQIAYEDKLNRGMSEEQAYKETFKEYIAQLGMSAGTGYLMGSAMQGGQTAINHFGADIAGGLLKKTAENQSSDTNELKDRLLAQRNAVKGEDIPNIADVQRIPAETDVVENVSTPIENIEPTENIPAQNYEASNMDVPHQIASKYAQAFSDYDTYDYMDNVQEMDGLIEKMADDIANGRDLSEYRDALEEAIEEAPDVETEEKMQDLVSDLDNVENQKFKVMAEAATNRAASPIVESVQPESIEGEPVTTENFNQPGKARSMTNTMPGAGIYSKIDFENSPTLQEIAEIARVGEEESYNSALETVNTRGQEWYDDVVNGKYILGSKENMANKDFDTGMILLQGLAEKLEATTDPAERQAIVAQRDALIRKMKEFSHNMAIGLQAHKKWTNTADGAIMAGEQLLGEQEQRWKSRNKSKVEGNKRIADALRRIGYDGSMDKGQKEPLTHEQIRNGVIAELAKEYGSVSDRFDDNFVDVLTNFAENRVPVDIIADEIQHYLNHGEFYTIDESTPVKKQMSGKLASILKRMGDDSQNASNKPLDNGYPKKSHATFVDEVRNTLGDEYASLGLDKPTDIEFIATMLEEKVPDWQIEDEINHRLMTGEWYSLDESIEPPKPTSKRLENALNALVAEDVPKAEKEPLTYKELQEQVRNTIDNESASASDFTDDDINYLAGLLSQGATKEELVDALNTKMATGTFGVSADTQAKVNELFKAMDMVNPESKDYSDLQLEAFRLIANETNSKASALEKFDAWRYLAMLGNPKTMIRNWVGNQLFNVVTGISNNLSALGEMGVDAISKATGHGGIERTKAIINPFDRQAIKAAKNDFNTMRYVSGAGTKYKDTKSAIKDASSVFDSKWAQLYEKLTDAGISDTSAVRRKYATSLIGYMKANGLTDADMDASYKYDELRRKSKISLLTDSEKAEMENLKSTADAMDKARDYALKQADYATFHEDNKVAQVLTELSEKGSVAKVLVEGLVPFKKTPANVLRSGVEYSPFGAISSIAKTGKLIYENTGSRKGNLDDVYKSKNGKKDIQKTLASDVIDSWSKTLTGSALAYLGYYLFSKGILTSSRDDEKYQDNLEGIQNYALKINGHTYTIDWAAPGVMPLLLGAELKKIAEDNAISDEKWYNNAGRIADTINALLEPVMETSMLQGINDTLTTAANQINNRNGETNAIAGILGAAVTNMATSYLTQAIPTASGQLARAIDGTRRTTDTVTEGLPSVFEKQGRKIMNKLPVLSMLNNPYVDARGETQSNNPFTYEGGLSAENALKFIPNLAYQSLSPGYLDKIDTRDSDRIAREAYNALDENGKPIRDSGVFADWKSQVKINGQKLTPEQMQKYRETGYSERTKLREALAKEDWYNNLSGTEKTEILKSTNSLADNIGKSAADPEYTTSSKVYEAYATNGIQGVLDYYKDEAHKGAVKDALGTSAEWAQEVYDTGSQTLIDKFKQGNEIAQSEGFDGLSKEQWKIYNKRGETALRSELKYARIANDAGVSDSDLFRQSVNSGISPEAYKKEDDLIKSIQIGTDEFGDPKYMTHNETTADIYRHDGLAGLNNYAVIQKKGYGKTTYDAYKHAKSVKNGMSIATYLGNVADIERYNPENKAADGQVSQKELLGLFNARGFNQNQANDYWNTYLTEYKEIPSIATKGKNKGKWTTKKAK